MKRTYTLLTLFITFFSTLSFSQTPTYELTSYNFRFSNDCGYWNAIDFDIYLRNTGSSTFEYSGGQYFLSFDPSIANGGTLTLEIVGSDLPVNMRPRNPSIGTATSPTAMVLRTQINAFPGAGFGYIVPSTGFGVKVATLRLKTSALSFTDWSQPNIDWRNPPIVSFATKIFAYIGSANTDITTPATHFRPIHYCGFPFPTEEQIPWDCCQNIKAVLTNLIIEGLYNLSVNKLNRKDPVTIELRHQSNPAIVFYSTTTTLDSLNFSTYFAFNTFGATSLYLVIKHFNSIETWSSITTNYSGTHITYYNFTDSDTKAYGNNLKLVGDKFTIYSGDVNQDGVIDATDLSIVDNDSYNSLTGRFIPSDLNGDDIVDGTDLLICENNAANFVTAITPLNSSDHDHSKLNKP